MRKTLVRAWMRLNQRETLRRHADLQRTQWLPPRDREALTLDRLRATLRHAAAQVPYYAELFRSEGFDPEIPRLERLAALPPLDRATLVRRFEDLRARDRSPGARPRATGGSTGTPVRVLLDESELASRAARQMRGLCWLGWQPGGRLAYLWGSDADAREHKGWRGALRDAVTGVVWLDAFTLRQVDLDAHLRMLERHDPDVLIGYPSSLHVLARRALDRGRTLRLRGIETSAEVLSPRVRDDLRAAFGCPVRDRYGCREAGIVAHECEAGRLHTFAESVHVEVAEGSILLTTLDNRAMPLIRYRNEDLAEPGDGPCSCGRSLPTLAKVIGRSADIIRSPAGRLIHGEFFTHLFYDAPGVTRFQVRQAALDHLVISVVGNEQFDDRTRSRLAEKIARHGDPAFRIEWRNVSTIEPGPAGKHRFTLSDLRS